MGTRCDIALLNLNEFAEGAKTWMCYLPLVICRSGGYLNTRVWRYNRGKWLLVWGHTNYAATHGSVTSHSESLFESYSVKPWFGCNLHSPLHRKLACQSAKMNFTGKWILQCELASRAAFWLSDISHILVREFWARDKELRSRSGHVSAGPDISCGTNHEVFSCGVWKYGAANQSC